MVDYQLSGDFEESSMEGQLSGTEQIAVTLTEGFGNKTISLSIFINGLSQTKSVTIAYVSDDEYPYQYYGTTTYTSGWTENTCDLGNMTVVEIPA